MKIHEKDPASGLPPISSPPSPTKRRRPSVKRRHGHDEENDDEPQSKKVKTRPSSQIHGVLRGVNGCGVFR